MIDALLSRLRQWRARTSGPPSRRALLVLLSSLAAVVLAIAAWRALPAWRAEKPPPPPSFSSRAVKGGVAVEVAVEPLLPERRGSPLLEGTDILVRFKVTDATSGTPIAGLYPAAWIDPRPAGATDGDEKRCSEKIARFLSGGLTAQAEVDLNVYYVLILNDDSSISVVDPRFGFGKTQLLTLVVLPGQGADWAMTEEQSKLFVSIPDKNSVAVVDPTAFKVTGEIPTAPRPTRVALQPDGGYLWVMSGDGAPSDKAAVTVIAVDDLRVVATLPVGGGHHSIAFAEDSRTAFVANGERGTVSIIDVRKLAVVKEIPVGRSPGKITYSRTAQAAYVTDADEGTIIVIDGRARDIVTRVTADPGIAGVAFDRKGRLGFGYNPERDRIYVLDAAVNRIVQAGDVQKGPDEVTFSDGLAYIRHRGSDMVQMVPLDQVGTPGRPIPVVDFTGGNLAPGPAKIAESIVRAPGETAMLVANAADKVIYYYKEGMAAPMGHLQTYKKTPLGVKVLDRTLRQRSPGVYETTARLQKHGPHELLFVIDSPKLVQCFGVDIAEDPGLAKQRLGTLAVEVLDTRTLTAGQSAELRVRITDPATKEPKSDVANVQVLTYRAPGVWHQRAWATSKGEGIYTVDFVPPEAGTYYVMAEVFSPGGEKQTSKQIVLTVDEDPDF